MERSARGPQPPAAPESSRRRFLKRGLALGAALAAGGRSVPGHGQPAPAPDDPSKVVGGPMVPYGERSRFEEALKEKGPPFMPDEWGGNFTPLEDTVGIITPSALHYEVCRGGIPDIDPRRHRLLIHGLVERPLMLTIDELKRLPSTSRILFLECAGNTRSEWRAPTADKARFTHGLTSCSEWTGVALSLLLREAGAHKGAAWIVAEGADATGNERSIPMAKAMDDVLVAYGQNGEAARPGNGYPLRLIVPGWEGNVNVKWLRRIKVVDRPYMTRMEAPDHTSLLPSGKARQFLFVMEAKSVITFPACMSSGDWRGRVAGSSAESRSPPMVERPGERHGSRRPSSDSPTRASRSTGGGTGGKPFSSRGVSTKPATSSRSWPSWSRSAA